MKAIFDRVSLPKKFPLSDFLLAIREEIPFAKAAHVSVTKIGGIGKAVWKYESQLDEGMELKLEFQALEELSLNPEATVDELFCVSGSVCFGISDATCLFFQSADKSLESVVASRFREVKTFPDFPLPT